MIQNGNLTSKTEGTDSWTYSWNAENQLTKVEKNGAEVARFAYDPLGRRVEKVAGGVTTTSTYKGDDILREVRGGVTFNYVHGPWIDEPLAREDGTGARTYYHADALGSIVRRTSAAGGVLHEYRYDAWGNIESDANEPGYAFTGREWDPETGLAYYRARYYDQRAGRFVSEDPIGLLGGLNFFSYVLNNPVRFGDPFGLMVNECHRPMQFGSVKAKGVPHGYLWSTKCQQSYSYGPKVPFFGSPSHNKTDDDPFDPDGKPREESTCRPVTADECYESCVCKYIQAHTKNPPWYSTGPRWGGENSCTDMKDWVMMQCTAECRGKKK